MTPCKPLLWTWVNYLRLYSSSHSNAPVWPFWRRSFIGSLSVWLENVKLSDCDFLNEYFRATSGVPLQPRRPCSHPPLTDQITRGRLWALSMRSHLASTCISSDLLCWALTPLLCMQINTTDISACKDQHPAGSVYLLEAAALKQTKKKKKEKKVEERSGQINVQLTKMLEALCVGSSKLCGQSQLWETTGDEKKKRWTQAFVSAHFTQLYNHIIRSIQRHIISLLRGKFSQ